MGKQTDKAFRDQALHLAALSGFAIAQPIYAALVEQGSFFLGYQLTPLDSAIALTVISVLLPLALAGLVFIARKTHAKVQIALYSGLLFGLLTLFILPVIKPLAWPSIYLQAGVAGLLAWGLVWLIHRFRNFSLFLTYLSPALLIFPLYFLFSYPGFKSLEFPKVEIKREIPVVLVVFDELSTISLLDEKERIDAGRYPHFARLAQDATWFRNAVTVHSDTSVAVPSILTGKYPRTRKTEKGLECSNPIPSVEVYPENLFTLLGHSYKLNAFESYLFICPPGLCQREQARDKLSDRLRALKVILRNYVSHILFRPEKFNAVFESFRGAVAATSQREANHKADLAAHAGLLESIRHHQDDKAFYFFHPLLPHSAWEFYPSGKMYKPSVLEEEMTDCDMDNAGSYCKDPVVNTILYQRHLLQTGYTDKLLGEITDSLKKAGIYDKALIIVTADHGISFRAGNWRRRVSEENYADIMRIPLLVKWPHQANGTVDNRFVPNISAFSTIQDVLGVNQFKADAPSLKGNFKSAAEMKLCATKELQNRKAEAITTQSRSALQNKLALFGSRYPESLFAAEAYRHLLGKSPRSVPEKPASLSIELDADVKKSLHQIDLSAPLLPLNIQGRLIWKSGHKLDNPYLAIGVNGKIRAVTQAFHSPVQDADLINAYIPEEALQHGQNEIQVYLIEGTPQKPSLHPASLQ